MKKQEAEAIIKEYLKPIFGFAVKRCKNLQDAEYFLFKWMVYITLPKRTCKQ